MAKQGVHDGAPVEGGEKKKYTGGGTKDRLKRRNLATLIRASGWCRESQSSAEAEICKGSKKNISCYVGRARKVWPHY